MKITNTKLNKLNRINIFNCRTNLKKMPTQMILPGMEIGVPLTIFQNIFTTAHYGYDISNENNILLQFCIGYCAYGTDRLLDYYNIDNESISINKIPLYNKIERNKELMIVSLILSYIYVITYLNENEYTMPFIFLLLSTVFYKPFKNRFGELKSLYISIFWTLSSVILPCIINDSSYEIFYDPGSYIPALLTIFSYSSIADIKDINEDFYNNINTIPVMIGKENTYKLGTAILLIANIIFLTNPHFSDRLFVNSLFEIQNIGVIAFPLLGMNNITFTKN